jgi:hypothetical protein
LTGSAAELKSGNGFAALKQANMVAFSKWMVNRREFNCVVFQSPSGTNPLPVRTLSIYGPNSVTFEHAVFKVDLDDGFIGMWPTKDENGDLVTLWEGPTAYHLEIIGFLNGKLEKLLSVGASIPPEIVYLSETNEKPCILITDTLGRGEPDKWRTSIYRWNGKTYKLTRSVAYRSRFSMPKKE